MTYSFFTKYKWLLIKTLCFTTLFSACQVMVSIMNLLCGPVLGGALVNECKPVGWGLLPEIGVLVPRISVGG